MVPVYVAESIFADRHIGAEKVESPIDRSKWRAVISGHSGKLMVYHRPDLKGEKWEEAELTPESCVLLPTYLDYYVVSVSSSGKIVFNDRSGAKDGEYYLVDGELLVYEPGKSIHIGPVRPLLSASDIQTACAAYHGMRPEVKFGVHYVERVYVDSVDRRRADRPWITKISVNPLSATVDDFVAALDEDSFPAGFDWRFVNALGAGGSAIDEWMGHEFPPELQKEDNVSSPGSPFAALTTKRGERLGVGFADPNTDSLLGLLCKRHGADVVLKNYLPPHQQMLAAAFRDRDSALRYLEGHSSRLRLIRGDGKGALQHRLVYTSKLASLDDYRAWKASELGLSTREFHPPNDDVVQALCAKHPGLARQLYLNIPATNTFTEIGLWPVAFAVSPSGESFLMRTAQSPEPFILGPSREFFPLTVADIDKVICESLVNPTICGLVADSGFGVLVGKETLWLQVPTCETKTFVVLLYSTNGVFHFKSLRVSRNADGLIAKQQPMEAKYGLATTNHEYVVFRRK